MRGTEFDSANDLVTEPDKLRRRIDRDGFVFFRGLIDAQRIRDLRLQALQICRDGGWINAGPQLADGVANTSRSCAEPDPEFYAVYRNVYKLEAFHRLAHSPEILGVMEVLVEETVLPHPQLIGRIVFPGDSITPAPPHQDFIHIQGTPRTYTCWIPLGDCPRPLGGLMILAGSHSLGLHDHHVAKGAGFLGVRDSDLTGEWFSTDYKTGDALVFHSHTIHRALPNVSDRLRVSVDYRYQGVSQPIAEPFLDAHISRMRWDEVYAGWRTTDLQYYWRNFDLNIVERGRRYYDERDREALELARKGDNIALPVLVRMIEREADPEKRREFREALCELESAAE